LKRATQSGLVDKGLIDLNELVKVTYGGKGARGNAPVKNSKQIKDDHICVPSKSHFSIDYILSSKSSESIGSTLATMDFLGLVKQPGFVDIATGTVSGTTSAVKVRKIYNDTWLVAGGGKSAVEEAADDSDD
jgi:hypothetical protein